jgi:DNA-binding HxlR family transcriptional regulator
VKTK